MVTTAPSAASRRAHASPSALSPPVTRAAVPARDPHSLTEAIWVSSLAVLPKEPLPPPEVGCQKYADGLFVLIHPARWRARGAGGAAPPRSRGRARPRPRGRRAAVRAAGSPVPRESAAPGAAT